jgi:hypothetical protein
MATGTEAKTMLVLGRSRFMSEKPEDLTDQNWQPGNKFSPLGYLKYWCYKALYTALVGRSDAAQPLPIPVRSETPDASSHRSSRR